MEVQNFIQQLEQKLTAKNQQHSIYRKASAILNSLMHAANKIPNFKNTYANNNRALALYISAAVYKLLKKIAQGDQQYEHNLDAYLLLLSLALPQTNSDALQQGGLIKQLKNIILILINRKTNTPFMTRLAVSILSHTMAPQMIKSNYKSGQDRKIILDLFEMAIASTRNNALSRQCSRLLAHLIKNNLSVCNIIAQQAKNNLFTCLDDKRQLYFSNVKEVMIELPVRFLNDICHKIATNLADVDVTDPNQENYIAQTYFFLQKMTTKLLPSTLESILLVLVNAIPSGGQNDKIQLIFMQLIYEATLALSQSDQNVLNRLLSPIFSVMMQFLTVGGKISKFAGNLLSFMINNCIKPSLWRKDQQLSFQKISLQQNNKNFQKIICLLESLLSSRFSNLNQSAIIISQFISKLQVDSLSSCSTFIQKIVQYRSQLGEKPFKKIFESLLMTFGIQHMLLLYPMNLNGDIATPEFEDQNNLWMLSCIQKTQRFQNMSIFYKYIMPLIHMCRQYQLNTTLSKQRRQGYLLIEDLMWRCIKVFCKVYNKAINYEDVLIIIQGQIKKVNDSTLQQLSIALQELSTILHVNKLRLPTSEQLIKSLASILDINKNSSILILNAIKGLSKIAPVDYIKRVFDKNIQKLISLAQENNLGKEQQKNVKNLEILMAVNVSIDLRDPSVTTKYRISREQLLLRLINSLIRISGTFQKKGYKYLSQALNAAPRSLFLEILQLLQNNIKVDNSSKSHRLVVISKLWSWLKNEGLEENIEKIIGFIKTHIPEIMLALREQNKGARNQGAKIMGQFTETMQQIGLIQNFVQIVCVGLVGQRSEMKLATLVAIGVIIGKGFCTEQIFKQVLQIVLLLLKQKRQEIYKGVVEFCKRGILSQPLDKQAIYLPAILQFLFEQDQEGKMEHISMLRHFLLRLGKKHGRQAIENMIPIQHRKMFSHAIKMQNREKRKKKQQNIARRQFFQRQKQQKLDNESSSEEDDDQKKEQVNNMDIEQEGQLQQLDNSNNLLLKYDLEQQQFHFLKEQLNKPVNQKTVEKNPDEITFDANGMMIIEERKRQRVTQEEQKQQPFSNMQSNNTLNVKKKAKVQIHQVKQSGQTYKSTRARGDVQLKDKPEPYAFIQFSSKALNKRFKKRAQQVFDNLFQKKEGGLKGLKSRIAGLHI